MKTGVNEECCLEEGIRVKLLTKKMGENDAKREKSFVCLF